MKKLNLLFWFFLLTTLLYSQGDYYNGIDPNLPTFVDDLKNRIRSPFTKISYDNFDETNILNYTAQPDGNGGFYVSCVYSSFQYNYTGTFTWSILSREHTWCHSWMPSYPSESGNEYSDQHHLFPTHQNGANGVRSNHPLGEVVTVISSFLDGTYGQDINSNLVYEPRDQHKGDAARAILYMALMYDDVNGSNWDFNWLNSVRLPSLNEGPQSLELLIQWSQQDPPDQWEIGRNNYIQSIQQNRNPFIDNPGYINYIDFNTMTYKSSSGASTFISYNMEGASVYDDAGTYNLVIDIISPDSVNASAADVVLTAGNAALIGNFTTQTINFPAGSSAPVIVPITIGDVNGTSEFVFQLQNISGGNAASAGINANFTLTVLDAAQENNLVISEYSDASGTGNYIYEFVEFFNSGPAPLNIGGYTAHQINSTQSFVIPENTTIPVNGFLIICRNADKTAFENFWGTVLNSNVVYFNAGTFPQINGDERYRVSNSSGAFIDPADDFSSIALTANNRVYRKSFGNTAADWHITPSSTATPGVLDQDQYIPVELVSFTGEMHEGVVILEWKTASELNNYGFEVERLNHSAEIPEWQNIGFVAGNGTINTFKEYSYRDPGLHNGRVNVSYRLKQIDYNGSFQYSKIINLNELIGVNDFQLYNSYPNPFNPVTNISFYTPALAKVKLSVFNQLGEEVAILTDKQYERGSHTVMFNAAGLPSGNYFIRASASGTGSTIKVMLIK